MTDVDAATRFLAALQLADPTLPIGRFVHSHGLESWLDAHPAATEAAIEEVVRSFVSEGVARLDGAFVARAHAASTTVALHDLDRELTARKTNAAARTASCACGRQLARIAPTLVEDAVLAGYCAAVVGDREGRGNLAVVEGALARALGVGALEAVLLELRSAAAGLFSAAVRVGRLGPLRAQVLLARLGPYLAAAALAAVGADDLHSTTPALEIAALAHARRDARLFST